MSKKNKKDSNTNYAQGGIAVALDESDSRQMQIADTLASVLDPLGVGVVMEAEHLCMQMRGIEKQNSVAVTSTLLGAFRDRPETRAEFFDLIGHPYSRTR